MYYYYFEKKKYGDKYCNYLCLTHALTLNFKILEKNFVYNMH